MSDNARSASVRACLDPHVASFERIGRRTDVPDVVVGGSADYVAEQLGRYAERFLASREVEVEVHAHADGRLSVSIYAGGRRVGVAALTPVATEVPDGT
jgi:hypothetical protein